MQTVTRSKVQREFFFDAPAGSYVAYWTAMDGLGFLALSAMPYDTAEQAVSAAREFMQQALGKDEDQYDDGIYAAALVVDDE